jgi:hypothetical protein
MGSRYSLICTLANRAGSEADFLFFPLCGKRFNAMLNSAPILASESFITMFYRASRRAFIAAVANYPVCLLKGNVMPANAWSKKRERQYAHIKENLVKHGKRKQLAEEIAARVVNKERAQHGEAEQASKSSLKDMSAGRRGGLRSHRGSGGRTFAQLYNEARQRGVKGRSRMNKAQLEQALGSRRVAT